MTLNSAIEQLTEAKQHLGGGSPIHLIGGGDFEIVLSAGRTIVIPVDHSAGDEAVKNCQKYLKEAKQTLDEAAEALGLHPSLLPPKAQE